MYTLTVTEPTLALVLTEESSHMPITSNSGTVGSSGSFPLQAANRATQAKRVKNFFITAILPYRYHRPYHGR